MMTMFRTLLSCSVGALIVGGALTGCTASGPRSARLSARMTPSKSTAALADQTRRVLAQRDGDAAAALAERGHRVVRRAAPLGGAQAVLIDEERGVLIGVSDPRKDGCALGL